LYSGCELLCNAGCLRESFFNPFHDRRDLLRFKISRREVLDQGPVSHLPKHIDILHEHPSAGAMPGECDVQIFAIGHRQQRPVVFHTNHFRFARALRFVSRYCITLADPAVVEFQFQAGRALHAKLTDLRSYIDVVKRELGPQRYWDEAYAKARQAVAEQTATPQEAVIELLRAAVADKTMAPGQAVEELVKLLRTDLPASRKIAIRQAAKAAFETGDDIARKIRPFLKSAYTEQERKMNKRVFNNAPGRRM
jgi:hypothetical protein